MEKECPKCGSTMELGAMAGDPTWIRRWGSLRSEKPVHIPKTEPFVGIKAHLCPYCGFVELWREGK